MRHDLLKRSILASLCAVMVLGLGVLPANAVTLFSRTWVSGVGDDTNPCSRTLPCATFDAAIGKTLASGEINVLDPGSFGPVFIGKSITIQAVGVEAGVIIAGGGLHGIVVAAGAADPVNLVGLDIQNVNIPGSGPGLDGVHVQSAGQVHIHNCTIRGFDVSGVHVIPNAGVTPYVLVTDTIFDNNLFGVAVTSANGGGATATALLDRVTIMGRGPTGGGTGVAVDGTQGSLVLKNSTVVRNQTGLAETNGGTLFSMGNNTVVQNSVNGTPNGVPNPLPSE